MSNTIPFIDLKAQQKHIRKKIEQRINRVLDHGAYILGPEVGELEQKLASYVGTRHCVSVSSGTDALLLALMAYDVRPGDEVITSPFSFIATAEVISLLGATPVFVDIDPKTYNINPALIRSALTKKTKAILPVSLYGQCAQMEEINKIGEENNIPVIEDAAQSFGAERNGKKSCALSDIGATSFFPSKPLGAYGDAGACFTNDDALAEKLKWLRVHGQDKRYHHPLIGINGRIDTIQAAILLTKLEIFPDEVKKRASIGQAYSSLLKNVVNTPTVESGNTHVYAQYTIQVDNRDALQAGLQTKGIPTAVHYPGTLPSQPAFKDAPKRPCPEAEKAARQVISLPMHPYLDEETQKTITTAIKEQLLVR